MLSSRGAAIITFKCAESAVCGLRPHGKVFFLSCGHSMRPASRRLLETALNEYQHEEVDHEVVGEHCYRCDRSRLPPELAECFVQLSSDEETRAFLTESRRKATSVCLQVMYAVVQLLLGLFLSQTSINGLLDRGKMFVFSRQHLHRLLPFSLPSPHVTVVLDIGSGDGHVTDKLRGVLGSTINVTETSGVMRRVLKRRGYHVVGVERWYNEAGTYDLISCLNVLDRCDCPLGMLRQIHGKLRPGGLLLLAMVLPYQPFVEKGPQQLEPTEVLPLSSSEEGQMGWEEGVGAMWTRVLHPLGFTPVAVTRVPYLCEGDFHQEIYHLDDAVMVLRKH